MHLWEFPRLRFFGKTNICFDIMFLYLKRFVRYVSYLVRQLPEMKIFTILENVRE